MITRMGSITQLFAQARLGDEAAFGPLCARFFPRLVALADKTLRGRPQRVMDGEDAAQAALASFWRQIRNGTFAEDLGRNSLWNLLAKFTLRKAGQQQRDERAAKRGGGRVLGEDQLAGRDEVGRPLDELAWTLPTQEFDMQMEELLTGLPDEIRPFATLRLLGHSTAEIADELGCTQRKAQRKLELVRLKWERLLDQ